MTEIKNFKIIYMFNGSEYVNAGYGREHYERLMKSILFTSDSDLLVIMKRPDGMWAGMEIKKDGGSPIVITPEEDEEHEEVEA